MSQIIDHIFADVCLDERIPDGIFKLEEEEHISALRDHLIKRGLALEDAIAVTNKMVEGKYPQRQVYQAKTGILVTFPTPQHKAKAMKENPGKYVDQDPNPKSKEPTLATTPAPKQEPSVPTEPEPKSVSQGDKILAIEPPRGPEKPEPPPSPPQSPVTPIETPEKKAAEKFVVQQMINSPDSSLSETNLSIDELCKYQLNELYKKAEELKMYKAYNFLKQYIQ